jgi:integrase
MVAMKLAVRTKDFFKRVKDDAMAEYNRQEIQRLLNAKIKEWVEGAERDLAQRGRLHNEEAYIDELSLRGILLSDANEQLALQDFGPIKHAVDGFLEENGLVIDPDSPEYDLVCRDYQKANIKSLDFIERMYQMDFSYEDELKALTATNWTNSPQPTNEPVGKLISEVVEEFVAEKMQGENWTEKTKEEMESIFRLFIEIVGDRPINKLTPEIARHYKKSLMKLPPNRKKQKRYRDLTVQEILKMKDVKPMSTTTINKNLGKTSGFLKWAKRQGYLRENYLEGMSIPTKKRESEARNVFTTEDLNALFHSREYIQDRHTYSYCFWIPVIGLFTGMRINEIAQLHIEDIRQEDGVWIFDVKNEGDRGVKTLSSNRIIPLHPFLVEDLKLPPYVAKLKNREKRLFPELKKYRDKFGGRASKWFARYRERCGVNEGGKAFHSFRHNFVNHLKQKLINDVMIKELAGHKVQGETMGRYGKRYEPRILYNEAIIKIDYGIDLSHLKQSKYVPRR